MLSSKVVASYHMVPPLLASLHPPAEGRRERRSVVPPSLATRSPVVLRPPGSE